jgi:hypothetical protein
VAEQDRAEPVDLDADREGERGEMVALRGSTAVPPRWCRAHALHGTSPLIYAVEHLDHVALAVAPHPDGAFAKPKFPPDELISLFTRGNVMRHDYT